MNTRRRVITTREKLKFIKTLVSWIRSKDILNSCFILNYGYEAPLPWPQVNLFYIEQMNIEKKQVRLNLDNEAKGNGHQLVPKTNGMEVPNSCTIVIIAGENIRLP